MNSYIRVTSNWSFSLNFFSSVKQSSAESNLQFFILFLIHTHTQKGKLKKNSMLYDEIWSDVTAVLFSPFVGFNCIYCIQFNPSLKTTLKVKIACWSEGWTHDKKIVSPNSGRSGERIFFSRVNFACWLLFSVRSTLVLPQWYVKDPGHSAKSAGGSLHRNTHMPLT